MIINLIISDESKIKFLWISWLWNFIWLGSITICESISIKEKGKSNLHWISVLSWVKYTLCIYQGYKLQNDFNLNIGHVCKASILCWNGTWMFISITFLWCDEAWLLCRNDLRKDQRKFHMCFWGWLVSFNNSILSGDVQGAIR